MSPELVADTTDVAQGFVLDGVPWVIYRALRALPLSRNVRMTYLDGTLYLMSPEYIHEKGASNLAILVMEVALALSVDIEPTGATTLRRKGRGKQRGAGKEPDTGFYVGMHAEMIRGCESIRLSVDPLAKLSEAVHTSLSHKFTTNPSPLVGEGRVGGSSLRPRLDPPPYPPPQGGRARSLNVPPDLALEVDKADSLAALTTYARLRVPEVWRYRPRQRTLWFGMFNGKDYEPIGRSLALPMLTPELVLKALDGRTADNLSFNAWRIWLAKWARALPLPPPGDQPGTGQEE